MHLLKKELRHIRIKMLPGVNDNLLNIFVLR